MIPYKAAIIACEKGMQPDKVLELPVVMQRKGLAPGMIIYSAAISACEKGKQPDMALVLPVLWTWQGLEPTCTPTVQRSVRW